MAIIIPDFSVADAVGGSPAIGSGFVGNKVENAFNFMSTFISAPVDEVAYANVGALSSLKMTSKSSLHRNRVTISQAITRVGAIDKLTISFWTKINDTAENDPWGLTTDARAIIGSRQAGISDTSNSNIGWSFGVNRNSGTPTKFDCTFNVNGEIVQTTTGVFDFDQWYFVIASVDVALDYMGFSLVIPEDAAFPNDTTIYDINDSAIGTVDSIAGDSNSIIIGADTFSSATDGSRFYLDGAISNLKFYSNSVASTNSSDVVTFFSSIASKAWVMYSPAELTALGAVPASLISSYSFDIKDVENNTPPVIQDRNFQKRNFLARGFSGDTAVDYSTDLPTSLDLSLPNTRSLVFDGSQHLEQRSYKSSDTYSAEGQFGTDFKQDYMIEFWFNCSTLPSVGDPVQYLLSKVQLDSTAAPVSGVLHGFYLALVYDAGDIKLKFYHDQGLADNVGINIQSGAIISTISVDTWYHAAIIASNPSKPLDGAGTAAWTQTYLFLSLDANSATTYEAFADFDPATLSGIAAASGDDFVNYPMVVGAAPAEGSPDSMINNFQGLLTELRIWKEAKTFNQLRSFRLRQLPIDLPE